MSSKTPDDQSKVTSQWITSLAVAVVCCAFLFLVFAIYIADLRKLNDQMSLTVVRLEALQTRQMQLISELDMLRRPAGAAVQPAAPSTAQAPPAATIDNEAPTTAVPDIVPPAVTAPSPQLPGAAPALPPKP